MNRLLLPLIAVLCAGSAYAGAVDRLAKALTQNENYKVRLKAATRLGTTRGGAKVEAPLLIALTDPHHLVRAAAANSLGRLKVRAAVPGICRLRADTNSFTRDTATAALQAFGGPSACVPQKVFVNFEVTPAPGNAITADTLSSIDGTLRRLSAADTRIVLDAAQRKPDMNAVTLKVAVQASVDRSGATIKVGCAMTQAVFDAKLGALRGSARQRAAVDLGTNQVTEPAIAAQQGACMQALVPVVHEGLTGYLDRLK